MGYSNPRRLNRNAQIRLIITGRLLASEALDAIRLGKAELAGTLTALAISKINLADKIKKITDWQ